MSTYRTFTPLEIVAPVKCEYCRSDALVKTSNCKNCGGPLTWPETTEVMVERELRLSREMLDCTSMADLHDVYVLGILDARLRETSHVVTNVTPAKK